VYRSVAYPTTGLHMQGESSFVHLTPPASRSSRSSRQKRNRLSCADRRPVTIAEVLQAGERSVLRIERRTRGPLRELDDGLNGVPAANVTLRERSLADGAVHPFTTPRDPAAGWGVPMTPRSAQSG
jgi:hypothetical protein